MNEKKLKQLSTLLDEYYKDKSKTCNYDCCNCELGILETYGSGTSCAIEIVDRNICLDLKVITDEHWFGEYKIDLIKCKDCKLKHYSESHNLWCDIFERIMPEDGYCCFGEV